MKYIGLDCHKKYDHATMIDTETEEIKVKRLAHTIEEFKEFIGNRAKYVFDLTILHLCEYLISGFFRFSR